MSGHGCVPPIPQPEAPQAPPPVAAVPGDGCPADIGRSGHAISIDSVPHGRGTIDLSDRSGPRHMLEIKKDGYQPFMMWVEVVASLTLSLRPRLAELPK
jgi:hypothetical protein